MVNNSHILTAAEMRMAEQSLIDAGVSVEQLMRIAGQGAAQHIWRIYCGLPTIVICGPGNNGGDGYVIAQWLLEKGVDVTVAASSNPQTEAARGAKSMWEGPTIGLDEAQPTQIFVDCLFGTGLSRSITRKLWDQFLRLAVAADKRVAVDLPSGVDADNGRPLNDIPPYDVTIALGAYKPAHDLCPAKNFVGDLLGVDIGIDCVSSVRVLDRPVIAAPRKSDHKYTRGLVCVLAGQMPGAARLTAKSAQMSGAGYVKIITNHAAPCADDSIVSQHYADLNQLASILEDSRISIVVVGPGLGRDQHAQKILEVALAAQKPLLLDADALVILGQGAISRVVQHTHDVMLTPHQGEFEKIYSGPDGSKIDRTKFLSEQMSATLVYKGADTVIGSDRGDVSVARQSSTWLSTAGTGDILAGVVAARYAATGNSYLSAQQAQWLHTRAARLAGASFSPEMLIDNLPKVIEECLV